MPKTRVYEIAQELNKTNKEVIEFLKEKKVEVKSHMSTLEEKDEKMVRDAFAGKKEGKEEKRKEREKAGRLWYEACKMCGTGTCLRAGIRNGVRGRTSRIGSDFRRLGFHGGSHRQRADTVRFQHQD